MSGFVLKGSTMARIRQELPELDHLNVVNLALTPDSISIKFRPDSTIPIAAVCLQDAYYTLFAARYALGELFAHRIWYQEESEQRDQMAADFYSRFYADDTALRLYSAGEHLANAIIFMLEISDQQLSSHRKHRVSQQSIVGNLLAKEKPNHPVTGVVLGLAKRKDWTDTMRYRSRLVHEQPPTVESLGVVYQRRKRWEPSNTGRGYTLTIGSGDEPEYSIDDLLGFIQPALFAFADTLTAIVDYYIHLLGEHGITIKHGSLDVNVSHKSQAA